MSRKPDAFGLEHEVWFPTPEQLAGRVIKATFGNGFGHLPDGSEARPVGDLERLFLCNTELGDQLTLLGVEECRPGVIRVVTTQPAIEGTPATQVQVLQLFEDSGFRRRRWGRNRVWYRPEDSLIASDTHGGNVLCTRGGALVAIDAPLMRWTDSMRPLELLDEDWRMQEEPCLLVCGD